MTLTRRELFAVLGGGIAVLLVDDADAQESGGGARRGTSERLPEQLSAWLHIGEDGLITACTGKVEVGQNARTSLTAAVAEELRAPLSSIRFVMGDTALTPFDMGTFGSRTTPIMWPQIRQVSATAREMLFDLAAGKWKVDRTSLSLAGGKVVSGARSIGFGELTRGEKLTRTIASNAKLAPAAEWKVAGISVPKVAGREFVTGAHRYPYDIRRPGMLSGKVLYPPQFGARLAALDASAAEAMPGVKVIRETLAAARDGFGAILVGVVAPDAATAEEALAALRPTWQPAPAQPSSKDVSSHFRRTSGAAPAPAIPLTTYSVAYIAHVPLEPRAAVAEWEGDKLTVWTGTQRPFGVRSELAQQFKVDEGKVRVIVPDTGSGYGGKHTGDAAIEAAILARAAGRPVKRNWTRQEELTWAYFRPGGVIDVGGTVNASGTLTDWEFHNYNSGASGLRTPYHVPGAREQYHASETPLRQGSYRGLAATANNFARECYMDELAQSIGADPLAFRLNNAGPDERLRAVLKAAADRFGWASRKKTPGVGFGIAAGFEKGGYVATCAEVAVANGALKVVRVVAAFECGAIVNPDHLRNQVEGALAMGLGGALFEQVEFAGGKIASNRLARYRVPRFGDMPLIESVLVNRPDLPPAGAGETPIIGLAPAIGNAICDASGKRPRALPMAPKGLEPS